MLLGPLLLVAATTADLRLEVVRESLAGTHYRYRQYVDGVPVAGGEVNVTVRPDGSREETRHVGEGNVRHADAYVNVDGVLRPARRVEDRQSCLSTRADRQDCLSSTYVDVESGRVLRRELPFAHAKPGRVFAANPVETLNNPSLHDQNNSAAAVPASAYSTVDLERVRDAGPLGGPHVQIVDTQAPSIAPVDVSRPLTFDRSQAGFEDVNAYFHIDRIQEHLRSLGFTGARAIAPYAVEVDTHAAGGGDTSFYAGGLILGRGALFFGDGGTDDAEDPDLVVHEYGHVIHDWIGPNTYLGAYASQARAVSEGFGDYWAFSAEYEKSLQSGRDPFCFADWDARCWNDDPAERCAYPPGSDCLRRLDSAKTMADFVALDVPGSEHRNGEIWSSALREIFVAMVQRYGLAAGKRAIDTIVIESLFGPPPNPAFATIARNMIIADRFLNGGANTDLICAAMFRRGILTDCAAMPRGEVTYVQSGSRAVRIPDNDPAGITLSTVVSDTRLIEKLFVAVDIEHPVRGDLGIVLIAPDSTQFLLQTVSLDQTPDIHVVFGRDSQPVNSLDVLRGRSAAGEWRLRVTDFRPRDAGTVLSWSLIIQFAGASPLEARPSGSTRQTVPVVGRTPGANGTFFVTDVRLLNRGSRETTATLIYTPAGADGRSDFGAVNVAVAAGEVVALDDIIGRVFGTVGRGQLEIDGDVIVTTRTYNSTARGTFGQGVPPATANNLASRASAVFFARLENSIDFRSNVGFAEVAGRSGTVRFGIEGRSTTEFELQPFGQIQMPVIPQGDLLVGSVEVIRGDAVVASYASTIDNRSGDAVFLPAERESPDGNLVAPVISAGGALGTEWRSDVWLMGIPVTLLPVVFTTTYVDVRGNTAAKPFDAPLGRTATLVRDVVSSLFLRPATRGVMTISVPPLWFIGSRTWTSGPDGTYGQFVPFRAASETTRDVFIESSDAFRTNVGLIADVASSVRVTILDASGREVSRSDRVLQPFILDQFLVTDRVTNGRARIELLQGRVYAYSSVVDNRTGDPTFVLGQ